MCASACAEPSVSQAQWCTPVLPAGTGGGQRGGGDGTVVHTLHPGRGSNALGCPYGPASLSSGYSGLLTSERPHCPFPYYFSWQILQKMSEVQIFCCCC